MMTILHIDSSILGEGSVSRRQTDRLSAWDDRRLSRPGGCPNFSPVRQLSRRRPVPRRGA
jgi:hypothetical protein